MKWVKLLSHNTYNAFTTFSSVLAPLNVKPSLTFSCHTRKIRSKNQKEIARCKNTSPLKEGWALMF